VLAIPHDKAGRTSHVPLNDAAFEALCQLRRRTSAIGLSTGRGQIARMVLGVRYAQLAPDFRMDAVQRMQKKFALTRNRARGRNPAQDPALAILRIRRQYTSK
jgi:hypothetical protein